MNPLVSALDGNAIIEEETITQIFSNLEALLEVNLLLLASLDFKLKNWSSSQTLGEVFIHKSAYLKLYTQYCRNYDSACSVLSKKRRKNLEFAHYLDLVRSFPETEDLSLDSYLIMPVQRIPRYKLLLEDLLKNTWEQHRDYQQLEEAIQKIQEVANHIDICLEGRSTTISAILKIQQKIPANHDFLVEAHRVIKKQTKVKWLQIKNGKVMTTLLYLFLFNDILILISKKRKVGLKPLYRIQANDEAPCIWTKDVEDESYGEHKNLLYIIARNSSFLISCKSPLEKQDIISVIENTSMLPHHPNRKIEKYEFKDSMGSFKQRRAKQEPTERRKKRVRRASSVKLEQSPGLGFGFRDTLAGSSDDISIMRTICDDLSPPQSGPSKRKSRLKRASLSGSLRAKRKEIESSNKKPISRSGNRVSSPATHKRLIDSPTVQKLLLENSTDQDSEPLKHNNNVQWKSEAVCPANLKPVSASKTLGLGSSRSKHIQHYVPKDKQHAPVNDSLNKKRAGAQLLKSLKESQKDNNEDNFSEKRRPIKFHSSPLLHVSTELKEEGSDEAIAKSQETSSTPPEKETNPLRVLNLSNSNHKHNSNTNENNHSNKTLPAEDFTTERSFSKEGVPDLSPLSPRKGEPNLKNKNKREGIPKLPPLFLGKESRETPSHTTSSTQVEETSTDKSGKGNITEKSSNKTKMGLLSPRGLQTKNINKLTIGLLSPRKQAKPKEIEEKKVQLSDSEPGIYNSILNNTERKPTKRHPSNNPSSNQVGLTWKEKSSSLTSKRNQNRNFEISDRERISEMFRTQGSPWESGPFQKSKSEICFNMVPINRNKKIKRLSLEHSDQEKVADIFLGKIPSGELKKTKKQENLFKIEGEQDEGDKKQSEGSKVVIPEGSTADERNNPTPPVQLTASAELIAENFAEYSHCDTPRVDPVRKFSYFSKRSTINAKVQTNDGDSRTFIFGNNKNNNNYNGNTRPMRGRGSFLSTGRMVQKECERRSELQPDNTKEEKGTTIGKWKTGKMKTTQQETKKKGPKPNNFDLEAYANSPISKSAEWPPQKNPTIIPKVHMTKGNPASLINKAKAIKIAKEWQSNKEEIRMEGNLYKKGEVSRRWHKYYCRITLSYFFYFKDHLESTEALGGFMLKDTKAYRCPQLKYEFCFALVTENQVSFFHAKSEDEMKNWIQTIRSTSPDPLL